MSWARTRHGTAGLTVPQARHGPSKLNRAVPGQESRHGVLARHGTRSRRAVPGHGGTVPCPGVPVPGRHGTPKWTCIPPRTSGLQVLDRKHMPCAPPMIMSALLTGVPPAGRPPPPPPAGPGRARVSPCAPRMCVHNWIADAWAVLI